MPISYELLPSQGVVRETWSGDVSIDEVRRHWVSMLRDKACVSVGRTLVDVREANLLFSSAELQAAVLEGIPLLAGRRWISAIVVRQNAQLHMASRYRALAAIYSQDAIFSQVDEAERWLQNQGG